MIVIRPILHWIGIPPVPIMAITKTIRYVFEMDKPKEPEQWSVDKYVTLLCKERYDPCYSSRLDELSSCKVTKLELYKEKNGLYHEFVLAYIRHSFIDKSGTEKIQTRVACLERIFKDAASSFDLTSKPDTPAPAVDSIVIYETKEDACASRDAYCCYVVDFSEPKGKGKGSDNPIPSNDDDTHSNLPNILDLAVAACTLNEIAENYSLFNTMRYWFANNLCRLLAQGRGYTVELRNKYRYKAGYFKQFPALASDGRITLCRSLSADALSPEARAKVVELGADSDNVIAPDSQEPPDASQFESEKTPSHFSQSTTITTNYYPKFIECHSKTIQRLRKADAEQNPEQAAKEKAQAEVREKDEKLREIDEKLRERDEKLREKDEELERLRAALQMQSASSKEAGGSSAAPSSLAAQ